MKKFISVFAVLTMLGIAILLAGCDTLQIATDISISGNDTFEAELGMFDCSEVKVKISYGDGTSEIKSLSPDMIPSTEQLKFYKAGTHDVNFIYGDAKCSFKLTVKRHVFDDFYTFEDETVVYDGNPHRLRISGVLPEGATVKYPDGNTFVDAGEYPVRMVVQKDGYETETAYAVLTILKADYDMSGVTFEDRSFVYDGTEKMIAAQNVPNGVSASYTIRSADGRTILPSAITVGTYTVRAQFTPDNINYNPIEDMTATLTIEKQVYDMSKAIFSGLTLDYDGYPHQVYLKDETVLPEGVTVSYKGYEADGVTPLAEPPVNAGTYIYEASFKGNRNYEDIPSMYATVTINKVSINTSNLALYSNIVDYDGEKHSLSLVGQVPDGVKVDFENNEHSCAGSYNVTARISPEDDVNFYVTLDSLEASLIVRQINTEVPFSPQNFKYDETNGYIVTGIEEGARATVTLTDLSGETVTHPEYGVTYEYLATFEYEDEERNASCIIADAVGNVSFLNPLSTFSGQRTYTFSSGKDYGRFAPVDVIDSLPENWNGTYTYTIKDLSSGEELTEMIHSGDYQIDFSLSQAQNYAIHETEFSVNVTIERKDLSGILALENKTVTYTGNNIDFSFLNMPDDADYTVSILSLDSMEEVENICNAGSYSIGLTFSRDYNNISLNMTVNKKSFAKDAGFMNNLTEYTGNAIIPNVIGIPSSLSYTMTYYKDDMKVSSIINAGTYRVQFDFENANYETFSLNFYVSKQLVTYNKLISSIYVTPIGPSNAPYDANVTSSIDLVRCGCIDFKIIHDDYYGITALVYIEFEWEINSQSENYRMPSDPTQFGDIYYNSESYANMTYTAVVGFAK